MILKTLRLEHFRNLVAAGVEMPPEGAVLEGANGQGKTNFLEAIHLLAGLRSFRGVPLADMIAFGAAHVRVEGEVGREDGSVHSIAVACDRLARRIALDGRRVTPARARGTFLAVLWSPEDLALAVGSPGRRRAWLDGMLAPTSARYSRAHADFERALRQRNEALRRQAGESELAVWDEALVAAGAPLVLERAALVEELAPRFSDVAASMAGTGEREGYGLLYRPSAPALEDEAAVMDAWRRALRADRGRDRARGWTGVGPQRDDIDVLLEGRPLARFGSQGERRTAAIALRLLEAETLERRTGTTPVLLLDDVFSELDEERAARLLAWLDARSGAQRFVTTPRELPWLDGRAPRWKVEAGRIEVAA